MGHQMKATGRCSALVTACISAAHRTRLIETALTQTGSVKGDLNFFMRPTDNLNCWRRSAVSLRPRRTAGSVVKPGAVEFAPNFRNPEVQQADASIEQTLPGRVHVAASAMLSLGRRLPVTIDTNIDPAFNPGDHHIRSGRWQPAQAPSRRRKSRCRFMPVGPRSTSTTGFAGRLNPNYQQITEITSRANSTYEAAMFRITRDGRDAGSRLHAHYTYAHAMDWNPNETAQVAGSDVLDPADF